MTWTKMTPIVDQVLATYGRPATVKIKNLENTEKILSKIVTAGSKSLHVIADFDATLTIYHFNVKNCESSYDIIANSPRLPEKLKTQAYDLFDKYYPIEVNVQMSAEEKTPYIVRVHSTLYNLTTN